MKKLLLASLLVLFVVTGLASAQQWIELQYNLPEGHQSIYDLKFDLDAKITMAGQEQPPFKLSLEERLIQKVLKVNDDGTFVEAITAKPLKLFVNNKEQQPKTSTTKPVQLTLDKFGDVKQYEVDGKTASPADLTKLAGGNVMLGDFFSRLFAEMNKLIAADTPELPKQSIKVGYQWYSYYKSPEDAPVQLGFTTQYTLLQVNDDASAGTIQGLSKAHFAFDAPMPIGQGATAQMHVQGTFQAGMWLQRDLETGELLESYTLPGAPMQGEIVLSGQAPAGQSAQPFEVHIQLTGKLHMKLLTGEEAQDQGAPPDSQDQEEDQAG